MENQDIKLEWYVLNRNMNTDKIENFNIFNNWVMKSDILDLCERYYDQQMNFKTFVKLLKNIIMYYEWSRCEYEIAVGPPFDENLDHYVKIDCYQQVLPNIEILAKYVIDTYTDTYRSLEEKKD